MNRLAPSILSADFSRLGEEVRSIEEAGAQVIHVDVMDGHFVPNISYGATVMKSLLGKTKLPFDVHLMIVNPDSMIKAFVKAGASIITVHYEVCTHLNRTIQYIKKHGAKASVCLNPHTPVSVLEDIIAELDMVLLMSVNPGFGGQVFIENTYKKVAQLRELIDKINPECLIEVDGGVNYETGKKLFECGANVLVAGSFVFGSENPPETISNLKKL